MDNNQPPPEVVIKDWTGDVHVYFSPAEPEIPEGHSRLCPQCGRYTWARSRWCWYCKFDFDRAACPRLHPKKVIAVGACALLALLIHWACPIS